MKKTNSILDDIIVYTKGQLEKRKKDIPLKTFEKNISLGGIRDFKKALQKNYITIIGEIKKQSPSKGVIRHGVDIQEIATQYEEANIDAISILTEPKYFRGDIQYIPEVKDTVSLPILRKDFIIDPYQLYESRLYDADACLLIARLFSKKELQYLYDVGMSLGMHMLVEVHDKSDLDIALEIGTEIIGINNRDLNTFAEDIATFEELAQKVPKDKLLIAESAIKTRKDVIRIVQAGAHAMLVGTTLMQSENIYDTVAELRGENI